MNDVPYSVVSYKPFESASWLSVALFGRRGGCGENELDWSLRDLQHPQDAYLEKTQGLIGRLCEICKYCNISKILSPTPQPVNFNAKVGNLRQFNLKFQLSGENGDGQSCELRKSSNYFDGVSLVPGYAALQPSADCYTTIAANIRSRWFVVAYTGLRSLYDSRHLCVSQDEINQQPKMYRASVVKNMLDRLQGNSPLNTPIDIVVHTTLGISPESYLHDTNDPVYWAQNRALVEYFRKLEPSCVLDAEKGMLSIPRIISAQFEALGVPPENISIGAWNDGSMFNTFADTNTERELVWHSYRQNQTALRNAVLVFANG